MHLVRSTAVAVALLASSALCQTIPLPGHSSTYNGFSRGFNFTANTPMIIAQLDLPPDAMQAGDTASYLVRVNGAVALRSVGNAGAISTNIIVNTGDVVDVIGNWSPATTTNFTAHNSYTASVAPYSTTILGVSHTLNRTGWQYDIGDPNWTSGSYLSPGSGQMGRVLATVTPQAGLFANFTSDVQAGASPLTVNFMDTSFTSDPGGITSWAWDFENDGTIDSTMQNPTHTYSACGSYDVSLTVTDSMHMPSTKLETSYIVTDVVTPSFTFMQIAPGVVQFTDTSTPTPTSWAWDLDGDGTVDSMAQNPVHGYPSPCTATTITLTVSRLCQGPFSTSTEVVLAPTSFTTTLSPNNGLSSNGAGNLFDIDVTNPAGVNICALTLTPYSTSAGTAITCDVYLTDAPGGHASNYSNGAVWRHVASGMGTDSGTSGAPTVFTLNNDVYIPSGTYGMAISTSQGLRYQTLSSGTTTWSGPDFSITAGRSASSFFTTGIANRGICATFHYSILGNGDAAGYGFFGSGCAGSMGISSLSNDVPPALGSTMTVTVDNLPTSVAALLHGFSKTNSVLGPLPLDVSSFGAPGCFLRVSADLNLVIVGASNVATSSISIPSSTSLIGILLYQQAAVIDPGFNLAGAVLSDASGMMVGL